MKSLLKFGQIKADKIVKGIFVCVAIMIIIRFLPIADMIVPPGTVVTGLQNYLLKVDFYIQKITIFIVSMILLKLICEVIFIIISACDIYIKDKS